MSETTPETATEPQEAPDSADPQVADAAPEQSEAEPAGQASPPDPAPAETPTEPKAEKPPSPEPAPEADDDWSDPEKGREAKRKANQEAKKLRGEIASLKAQLESRVDPEESKAAIALVEAESARQVARLKSGHQYGLPDEVTDLLQGDTPEEIEAHAKRLASHFSADRGLGRGGLDPTDEPAETDPKKLAAQIPRFH